MFLYKRNILLCATQTVLLSDIMIAHANFIYLVASLNTLIIVGHAQGKWVLYTAHFCNSLCIYHTSLPKLQGANAAKLVNSMLVHGLELEGRQYAVCGYVVRFACLALPANLYFAHLLVECETLYVFGLEHLFKHLVLRFEGWNFERKIV